MLYTMALPQKPPWYHTGLKAFIFRTQCTHSRPLTHFQHYTDNSNSLFGNVHPNKPELLTKNSINNPSTEFSAKFNGTHTHARAHARSLSLSHSLSLCNRTLQVHFVPAKHGGLTSLTVANAQCRKLLQSPERHHWQTLLKCYIYPPCHT